MSTAVERVPKCSIDEILALESGQSLFERDKPHDDRRRHSLEEPLQQPTQGARPRHSTKDRLPPIRQSHHMTGGEDIEEPPPGGMEEETAGDAFFMTQFLVRQFTDHPLVHMFMHLTNLCVCVQEREREKE